MAKIDYIDCIDQNKILFRKKEKTPWTKLTDTLQKRAPNNCTFKNNSETTV